MEILRESFRAPETFWNRHSFYQCKKCVSKKFVQCSEPCKLMKVKVDSRETKNSPNSRLKFMNDALHGAVYHRHLKDFMELLVYGTDVNAKDNQGRTALHMAALLADVTSARILIAYGANPNAICDSGNSVLFYALQSECLHIIQLLIDRGADVNADRRNDLYLHRVMDLDPKVCQILIHNGADVNTCDSKMNTPLHLACKRGRHELVELLLRHGAKINDTRHSDKNSLYTAIQGEVNDEIIRSLLNRGFDVNFKMSDGSTLLHGAVRHCKANIVREFLKYGANVNAVTIKGQTPLHCILDLPEKVDFDILKCLLRFGADVNARDRMGQTPLHYVTKTELNSSNVLQRLIDNGALVNAQDKIGWTPLRNAMRFKSIRNVITLLQNGANVTLEFEFLRSKFSKNHLIMKIFAFSCVSKFVLSSFGSNIDMAMLINLFGENNVYLYMDKCKRELEQMKTVLICQNTTAFQFLSSSKRKISIITSKCKEEDILPRSLLAQFICYGYLLKRHVNTCKNTKWICRAIGTLDIMCRSILPLQILENIVDSLTMGEMVNLVKAGQ